jgi:hypothetical protein
VFVNLDGFTVQEPSKQYRQYDIKVYVADRHARGSKAVRRGDSEGVGIYGLLKGVRDLINRKPVLKSAPCRLTGEKKQFYSKAFTTCIYQASYTF